MLPNTLLIVDLETTGLNPKTAHVIELGAILYSIPHHCVIQQFSTLLPALENSAENINKISPSATQIVTDFNLLINQFQIWVDQADYLIAHNAKFDKKWFGNGILPIIDKPWLCTYEDFIWPKNNKPTSLVKTALNHGITVGTSHRALSDCQLIADLFEYIGSHQENFETIFSLAISRSKVSKSRVYH
jgi:DNA polymerase-3 subunit epsilon